MSNDVKKQKLRRRGNGKGTKPKKEVDITSIDLVEQQKLEKNIEVIQANINKLQSQRYQAFTKQEKEFIETRIKMLEGNQIFLLKKFEDKFHKQANIKVDEEDNIPVEKAMMQKYPGLVYNVDNPDVRKEIGKSLSYNSGFAGYTEKEAQELQRLLDS